MRAAFPGLWLALAACGEPGVAPPVADAPPVEATPPVEAAPPAPPVPADPRVRVEVAEGTVIDWTSLTIEVVAEGRPQGVGIGHEVVEQQARFLAGPRFQEAIQSVAVAADLEWWMLLRDPVLGPQLTSRTDDWRVDEVNYFSSGRVGLLGRLGLVDLLRPWSLSVATVNAAPADGPPPPNGVLVDARGVPARPAFAPRLTEPGGETLWDGHLTREHALVTGPAIWVTDPAAPEVAARVGASPLVVKLVAADGAYLVVAPDRVEAVRAAAGVNGPLRAGRCVVVVDPP